VSERDGAALQQNSDNKEGNRSFSDDAHPFPISASSVCAGALRNNVSCEGEQIHCQRVRRHCWQVSLSALCQLPASTAQYAWRRLISK
jgi:hypothetical protein